MQNATTSRLEAFSDGVFAIAITLLILNIRVPSADEVRVANGLWAALALRWPNYVGYLISFFTIGVMWANHHAIFEYIKRADRRLLLANLLLLMGVGFLPFPTAVLADHLSDPHTRTAATVFYGATLIYTSLSYNLVWWLGYRERHLLGTNQDARGRRTITFRYLIALAAYAAATAVAPLNVWLSLGIYFGLALWNSLSERTPSRSAK